MPWKTSDLLQQREEFVKRAACGDDYFSKLCRSFGISRQTGYKCAPRLALSYAQLDGKWIDITASPINAIYGEDNVVATI